MEVIKRLRLNALIHLGLGAILLLGAAACDSGAKPGDLGDGVKKTPAPTAVKPAIGGGPAGGSSAGGGGGANPATFPTSPSGLGNPQFPGNGIPQFPNGIPQFPNNGIPQFPNNNGRPPVFPNNNNGIPNNNNNNGRPPNNNGQTVPNRPPPAVTTPVPAIVPGEVRVLATLEGAVIKYEIVARNSSNQPMAPTEIIYNVSDVPVVGAAATTLNTFQVNYVPNFSIVFKLGTKKCTSVNKKVERQQPVSFSTVLAGGGLTCE